MKPAAPPERATILLAHNFAGARILVAEDEPVNREIAQERLRSMGLHVSVAENGREAVSLTHANPYNLILMDMHMPEMDGLEATRQIRLQPGGIHIPIIAMTGSASSEDKARCVAAGMDDYILKPAEPEVLYATLLKWLSSQQCHVRGTIEHRRTLMVSLIQGEPANRGPTVCLKERPPRR